MRFLNRPTLWWLSKFRFHSVYFLAAAAIVLFSYPAWLLPGTPGTDDLSNLNIPQRQLLGWFFHSGHWPLWNPFNFAGQPLLAAGQSGPLYIPNILFAVFPVVAALKLSYIFHLLLVSFGMYGLVWRFTRQRLSSFIATVAFADCGFLVGHQIHTQMFDAVCWLPLVVWMFLRLQEGFTKRRLATFALVFAGQVFTGHPQIVFYTVFFILFYALLMWLWKPAKAGLAKILWGLLGMILGALAAAAQLLPTLGLIGYSDRSQVSDAFLLLGSLVPRHLLQFLLPFTAGGGYTGTAFSADRYGNLYYAVNFWEFLPFIGIVFLAFGIATAVSRFMADPRVRAISIIGIFSLMLAFGGNTIFSDILTHVPGFDLFRVPARYLALVDFSVALLAGIGAGHLISSPSRLWRMTFLVLQPVFLVTLLLVRVFGPYRLMPPLSFWIPVLQLLVILVLSVLQLRKSRRWPSRTLVGLGIAGLVYATFSLSPFVDWEPGSYTSANALEDYVKSHLNNPYPFMRTASLIDMEYNTAVNPPLVMDRSASFGIPSLNGYDSLEPTWYVNKINLTWLTDTFFNQSRQLVDALDTQYIVTDQQSDAEVSKHTRGVTRWMRWIPSLSGAKTLNIHVSPQFSVSNPYAALFSITLKSKNHEFTQTVVGVPASSYMITVPKKWPRNAATQIVLQSQNWSGTFTIDSIDIDSRNHPNTITVDCLFGPRPWQQAAQFGKYTVWKNPDTLYPAWVASAANPLVETFGAGHLKSWEPNREVWQISAAHSGLFVVSQSYDPSWTATVDNQPVSVKKIAGLLTGIRLPKGSHTVVLTYKPRSFQAGLGVSFIALLFCLVLIISPNSSSTLRPRPESKR